MFTFRAEATEAVLTHNEQGTLQLPIGYVATRTQATATKALVESITKFVDLGRLSPRGEDI